MRPPPAIVLVAAGLVGTSIVQALAGLWWRPSTFVAPVVAYLLWKGHARARFAAYVFFSLVAARAAFGLRWDLMALAAVALVLMQTAAARRHCPPLRAGLRVRMARP